MDADKVRLEDIDEKALLRFYDSYVFLRVALNHSKSDIDLAMRVAETIAVSRIAEYERTNG